MTRDNRVYLLIGQRGAGKSSYCGRLIENHSGFSVVSRDEILRRLAGSADTGPYSGYHEYAFDIMFRLLRLKLCSASGRRIILDCWTRTSRERRFFIRKLRDYGATRVTALYFVTPLESVDIWFWNKPGIAKIDQMSAVRGKGITFFSKDAPARDYDVFHMLAGDIDADGFDEVIRINPLDPVIHLQ